MDPNSKCDSNFLRALAQALEEGRLAPKIHAILKDFFHVYASELQNHQFKSSQHDSLFLTYLDLILKQINHPFPFEPFHRCVRTPFDYYQFGLDFIEPLVDKEKSTVLGKERLEEIKNHLKNNHNVVFLANHQIEADPQAISILFEKDAPKLAEEMIFAAGERVLTDPLAAPFSMGRNLLCIYSKRYIDNPPELKLKKQLHNKHTMERMSALLKEGGKCIYVAPSGGRDRPNADGEIEVAPFDPNSVEMFYLMARRAHTPTFFYPLALATYALLPPPQTIQRELGEVRTARRGAIHLAIGPCIDMEHFPGSEGESKHELRKKRAQYIWNLVKQDYTEMNSKFDFRRRQSPGGGLS